MSVLMIVNMLFGLTTYQHPHLDVDERELEPVPDRLLFTIGPVILTNVLFQPPCRHGSLLLREPARGFGKVRQDKIRREGDGNGNNTLNQEQPPPSSETQIAIHVARYACRDEA